MHKIANLKKIGSNPILAFYKARGLQLYILNYLKNYERYSSKRKNDRCRISNYRFNWCRCWCRNCIWIFSYGLCT
uniref:Uncharacterized protein n=1 Tax=Chondrus crispus TaxID=2769 RepID=Q36335_CHOCR|nr:hypothetical protein ChcroMp46 [Chondrus crispus]CAA87614.1 unnamed protein product [Chondrus crispus]